MLGDELLALSPASPIDAGRAAALVRDALGLGGSDGTSRDVSLAGGVAQGTVHISAATGAFPAPGEPAVMAIGAFDGLHLGHQALLDRAEAEAVARGCRLVVVTFSPDPAAVLGGPANMDLIPAQARWRRIQAAGHACVCVLRFTPELARLTYERFVREVLLGIARVKAIVVGEDFRLGARGAGDVRALAELGASLGFGVIGVGLSRAGGAPVTATRIRGLLAEGKVEEAAGLLTRPHSVTGRVAHGRGEGTAFGFPTANVEVEGGVELPAEGVYAGYVTVGAGRAVESPDGAPVDGNESGGAGEGRPVAYAAAINVGRPPTFEPGQEGARFLEATLIGFEGDLYGRTVGVCFLRWLRASRPFDSLAELERTVFANVDWTAKALGERGVSL